MRFLRKKSEPKVEGLVPREAKAESKPGDDEAVLGRKEQRGSFVRRQKPSLWSPPSRPQEGVLVGDAAGGRALVTGCGEERRATAQGRKEVAPNRVVRITAARRSVAAKAVIAR